MKKYFKFWSILVMFLVIIINLTYTRPRKINNILMTSPDTVFVNIDYYAGINLNSKNIEISQEEFNKVIELMSVNEYTKLWGEKKWHTSNSYSFYFITFKCYTSKNNRYQTITLSKDGYIKINNAWYTVAGNLDIGKEMIDDIYHLSFLFCNNR